MLTVVRNRHFVMMVVVIVMMVSVPMTVFMIMTVIAVGADATDMVVVANLRGPLSVLIADDLLAVFTELAVHQVVTDEHFVDSFQEGIDDQRVVAEIVGF